ncbi:MAG: pin [Marmoricola sp.]|nr:pin [Marmoricola sp.]
MTTTTITTPESNSRTGTLVGYARVSTDDQHTDLQLTALRDAGCDRVYEEKASGTRTDRPELAAALDYLRPGDTLIVWRLDRLGRSMSHLIGTVSDLDRRGVGFRSVTENIDTTTATGRLVFHLFSALAEFERGLLAERTRAGLAAARERGAKPGRKPSLTPDQVAVVQAMHATGDHTVAAIAAVVGVSRATVYRQLAPSA